MTITLKYFAGVREAIGWSDQAWPADVDVPATAGEVRQALVAMGPPWAQALATDQVLRIAVNHVIVDPDHSVCAGDEVAFFPPVTGG